MEAREQKSQTELLQIEEELTEGLENRHEVSGEEEPISSSSSTVAKRGRPRIPISWSRVLHVKQGELLRV
jgi:hypothetical protein